MLVTRALQATRDVLGSDGLLVVCEGVVVPLEVLEPPGGVSLEGVDEEGVLG